jgi:ATP-dependent HslUV protease ATP-binding subunit HslU
VEATKYTEVGFHGKDVDHIIADLVEVSMSMKKKQHADKHRDEARKAAELTVLSLFGAESPNAGDGNEGESGAEDENIWLTALRNGDLDDKHVEVDVPVAPPEPPTGTNGAAQVVFTMISNGAAAKPTEKQRFAIKDALPYLEECELKKLLEVYEEDITKEAIKNAENNGIIFIDEIDKICSSKENSHPSADASAEGVQRALLPLIEGSVVNTKHGNVDTSFILFICSGAFHSVKPSDLMAELQGRLPIRVQLQGLTEDDMYRILTEPVTNLVVQQKELLATEGLTLIVEDEALREIARVAVETNRFVENIGARRLHAILETVMEDISFEASTHPAGTTITVSKADVVEKLKGLMVERDLQRHIL